MMRYPAEKDLFDLMTADHDKLHLIASRLYDCIGRAVADFMIHGAHPGTGAAAATSGSHP